jgi:hypothetical protein
MTPVLSIRIPAIAAPPPILVGRFIRAPLSQNDYKLWTPSDYAFVYANANETPFTWDDVEVPRRSTRRAAKKVINYKV